MKTGPPNPAELTGQLSQMLGRPLTVDLRSYQHIPHIGLDGMVAAEIPSLGLFLCRLPFPIWSELDYHFIPRYPPNPLPVFAVSLDRPGGRWDNVVRTLYLSLVALTGARLEHPDNSVCYRSSLDGTVSRTIGPLGRGSLLLRTPPLVRLNAVDVAELEKTCARLTALPGLLEIPEILFAAQSLERGAMPGVGLAEDTAICAIALEELLMKPNSKQLTATFARRVGVLLNDQVPAAEVASIRLARMIYRARSQVLHGEADLTRLDWVLLNRCSRLALAGAITVIARSLHCGLLTAYSPAVLGELLDRGTMR
ncbi:hypothetical protein ACPSM1_19450 [Micromonospora chersina]|uniref:hypothetical protein n=1 Tax=Micromonospora chersina TaxID=47854 RepID=UPI003CC470D9